MNRFLSLLAFVLLAPAGFGQSASLRADTTALAPAGGTVTLTATTEYDFEPGALGWEMALPTGWMYQSVAGPNEPAVAPQAGATGRVEFAYIVVPARRAEFTFVLRYPAGAKPAALSPVVLLRARGAELTLQPEPLVLSVETSDPSRQRTK